MFIDKTIKPVLIIGGLGSAVGELYDKLCVFEVTEVDPRRTFTDLIAS